MIFKKAHFYLNMIYFVTLLLEYNIFMIMTVITRDFIYLLWKIWT